MSTPPGSQLRQTAKNIARRFFLTLPVLWLVVTVVFLLIHIVPGDPIVQMLGEGATAADIAGLRHAYGLDAPLSEQYLHYWRASPMQILANRCGCMILYCTWCCNAIRTLSR